MIVICPQCDASFESGDKALGENVKCPSCSCNFLMTESHLRNDTDLEKIRAAVGSEGKIDVDDNDTDYVMPPDIPEFLGVYKLERELAAGAVGKVFLAKHKSLQIPVAIKVLSRKISENLVTSQRFIREAQAAAQMNHINIVRILDCGVENEIIFYVMELINGGSTGEKLRRGELFSENESLAIGQSVCRALSEAVKHSIVHRDIKPDNIMIASSDLYKLADLGLAKSDDNPGEKNRADLTGFQIGMGTPHYMAPEQAIDAKNVDIRADIYSLGVSLFQLSTGSLPYPGNDVGAVLRKHAMKPIPNPKENCPELSQAYSEVIMKCMAKLPEDRFQTPKELEQELNKLRQPFMEDKPVHQDTVADMSAMLGSVLSGGTSGSFNKSPTQKRPYKIIIISLLLLASLLIYLLNSH
jgi:serine/threonine protein kinase